MANVGIVTNHTGVNSKLERTVDVLSAYPKISLTSIYSPEHGLDGTVAAGKYVESYTDAKLNLPVYSLYGKTRKPSPEMLTNVDVLVFDPPSSSALHASASFACVCAPLPPGCWSLPCYAPSVGTQSRPLPVR